MRHRIRHRSVGLPSGGAARPRELPGKRVRGLRSRARWSRSRARCARRPPCPRSQRAPSGRQRLREAEPEVSWVPRPRDRGSPTLVGEQRLEPADNAETSYLCALALRELVEHAHVEEGAMTRTTDSVEPAAEATGGATAG